MSARNNVRSVNAAALTLLLMVPWECMGIRSSAALTLIRMPWGCMGGLQTSRLKAVNGRLLRASRCHVCAREAALSASTRSLAKADIWTVSGLLVDVFSRELNPMQQVLVRLEHVVGLSQRHGQTALFVSTANSMGASDDTVVGFVEMFTAPYLASTLPVGTPVHIANRLKPFIASLAVHEDARGRGIGEALVRACEDAAVASGQRSVQIQVECGNEVALRLYARLGYRVVNMNTRATKLVGDILFGRSVTITKLTLEKRLAPIEGLSIADAVTSTSQDDINRSC